MGKRQSRAKKALRGVRRRSARVYLDGLEIARGHDGLLRGRPEPVLVVGLFGVSERGVTLLARDVVRWKVDAVPPLLRATRVDEGDVVRARVLACDASHCVAVLIAIEADSGADVRSVFASLERTDAWQLWGERESVPAPIELGTLATAAPSSTEVLDAHLLLDGSDLRDQLSADDLVGAVTVTFRDTGDAGTSVRARFLSDDGRNDWTALVRLVHS